MRRISLLGLIGVLLLTGCRGTGGDDITYPNRYGLRPLIGTYWKPRRGGYVSPRGDVLIMGAERLEPGTTVPSTLQEYEDGLSKGYTRPVAADTVFRVHRMTYAENFVANVWVTDGVIVSGPLAGRRVELYDFIDYSGGFDSLTVRGVNIRYQECDRDGLPKANRAGRTN